MAINKNSKAYQGLLDRGYTEAELDQMYNSVQSGNTVQQAYDTIQAQRKNAGTTSANNTTTSTANTTKSTSTTPTAMPEYQGTGGSATPKDTWWDKGNGNYSYNPASGYYESNGQTTTPVSSNPTVDSLRKTWDSYDYEKQQELLNKNPNLKDSLAKYGITNKQPGEATTTNTPTQTTSNAKPKNADGTNWDYQDNSQTRMDEIIGHLNDYTKTNPGLFSDYDTFYNAFIKGKGRTPEQEEVINDFFKKMKKYGDYDNKSSDEVGYLLAHGEPAEDYLSYLKYNDPQRYAEIQGARKKEEDKIKDDAALDTISVMTGDGTKTKTSTVIEWLKAQGLFVDDDGNLIDDRTENYASEEEKGYQRQIADLNARNLEIDNAIKNTYDDLVEKYPGATKSFLMSMAQDVNSDLVREKEDNLVELTRLQGYVGYMQQEREDRTNIGKDSISQLQKEYGMYYTYSPEGMSELAQAQYAATNVTLDQADNGTDTQKQMALQGVLDGYYDKYGAIIQRSEAQVINDVMAYAKKNGVSLSQALEENFLKPLRSKPQFATLSSGGLSPTVSFEKVGDTGYVLTVNPDGTYSIDTIGGATGVANNGLYGFTDYTPITTQEKETTLNTFMSEHPLDSTGGQCGSFVNDYLEELGYGRLYTDPIDKKKAVTNTDTASVGSVAVMDSKNYPEYGHTAIVTAVNGDKVKLLESNWGDDKKVHERWVNKSDILGYFDPSKSINGSADNSASGNKGYDPLLEDFFKKDPTKLTKDQWAKLKNMGYDERTFLSMRNNYLQGLAKEPDASTVKILDTLGYLMTNYPGREELMASFGTKYLPGEYGSKIGDYVSYVDYIKQNLTMDNLMKLKQGGATFGSLTEGERPRIEASATRLSNSMSKDKYLGELLDIYNSYARNAGMGELTLDDINNLYGGTSSSSQTTIKPMKSLQNSSTQTNNGDIDFDAVFASL